MTYSNEVKAFADSRETSYEIAQALFDLFPENAATVWAEPTDTQRAAVVSAAWKLADSDEDCLIWGCEKFRRKV